MARSVDKYVKRVIRCFLERKSQAKIELISFRFDSEIKLFIQGSGYDGEWFLNVCCCCWVNSSVCFEIDRSSPMTLYLFVSLPQTLSLVFFGSKCIISFLSKCGNLLNIYHKIDSTIDPYHDSILRIAAPVLTLSNTDK